MELFWYRYISCILLELDFRSHGGLACRFRWGAVCKRLFGSLISLHGLIVGISTTPHFSACCWVARQLHFTWLVRDPWGQWLLTWQGQEGWCSIQCAMRHIYIDSHNICNVTFSLYDDEASTGYIAEANRHHMKAMAGQANQFTKVITMVGSHSLCMIMFFIVYYTCRDLHSCGYMMVVPVVLWEYVTMTFVLLGCCWVVH